MNQIKFFSFALSPYALKVNCYLIFLGVEYETLFVNPLTMRKEIPVGSTIPVLTINDESRNESTEIGLWLNEIFPDKELVPAVLKDKVIEIDDWVSHRLIPHAFREFIGHDDTLPKRASKRWKLSQVLDQTSPNGISGLFRFLHLLFVGQTFVKGLVSTTDKSRHLSDLKQELAQEFEKFLEGGPFLAGSDKPTLADLSVYPQVVTPKYIHGDQYFMPGDGVRNWVFAMEQAIPKLRSCFPEEIQHQDMSPHEKTGQAGA